MNSCTSELPSVRAVVPDIWTSPAHHGDCALLAGARYLGLRGDRKALFRDRTDAQIARESGVTKAPDSCILSSASF